MKKSMIVVAILYASVSMLAVVTQFFTIWKVRAAELFGDGTAYVMDAGLLEFGCIYADWGEEYGKFAFLFFGYGRERKNGYIIQVFGKRIDQYGPYEKSNKWAYFYERETAERWSGWIEFRGHPRPFCGTISNRLPGRCMLIER